MLVYTISFSVKSFFQGVDIKRRVVTLRRKTDGYKMQMETGNVWVSTEMDVGEFSLFQLVS